MTKRTLLLLSAITILLSACDKSSSPVDERIRLLDDKGWTSETMCPEDLLGADCAVATDSAIKLEFYGWQESKDHRFKLVMPQRGSFRRVLLEYTMCTWTQGCSDWDMLTEIWVKAPDSEDWYELVRAITPYGRSFSPGWEKKYYLDVTHLLPILMQKKAVEFKIYYGGFDASETKAHAVKLKFYFFSGENPYGTPLSYAKVYDSFLSGNNGYRAWAYGVESASIEAPERLGLREIQLPEGTRRALLRVCLTGHGQEVSTSEDTQGHPYQGYFPGRSFAVRNPAEFDKNWYSLIVNGQEWSERGEIWEVNSYNYYQAGNYQTDRAGWGPGKPANVHYWMLNDIPADGRMTIDLNLDEYVSNCTATDAAYVANYYVMADIFAFQ